MRVIAVDDERIILKDFVRLLNEIELIETVVGFEEEDAALEYASQHYVDVAFLDIEMNGIGGLELARRLMEINPNTNIIYMTGYMEYSFDAIRGHASGYLLKPPVVEEIISELENLRKPVLKKKKVYVHTFGNFDIFVDSKPITFGRRQAKELLAYLIHKEGQSVNRKEIAAILFEDAMYDRKIQKQLQNIIAELEQKLREVGVEQILQKGSNSFSVNTSLFECDLYDFFSGKEEAINSYKGFYLENYSWAEEMNGYLLNKLIKK